MATRVPDTQVRFICINFTIYFVHKILQKLYAKTSALTEPSSKLFEFFYVIVEWSII